MSCIHVDILERYEDMLASIGVTVPVCDPVLGTSCAHLLWMLLQLRGDMPDDKADRWLGYVQGLLVAYKLTTVNVERDFTRPYFRGRTAEDTSNALEAMFDPRSPWVDIAGYLSTLESGRRVVLSPEQVSRIKRNLELLHSALREVPLVGAYHDSPDVCPTFYDGCNCTVENLEYQVQECQRLRDRLREAGIEP